MMLSSKGSFRIRSSKFRHIYGEPFKRENWYDNLQFAKSMNEGTTCSVNPLFLAVATSTGGSGSQFIVNALSETGKTAANAARYLGHKRAVVDLKFSPFDDHLIASASDDTTIRLWRVQQNSIKYDVTSSLISLHAHHRRVCQIEWHPTAENVMASIGQDNKVFVWNVERAQPVTAIRGHSDAMYCAAWNRDGSMLATTCRDHLLRLIDPRIGACVDKVECHASTKSSRCVFIDDHVVLTAGVSRANDREFAIWNSKSLRASQPVARESIDSSNGILMPFYDADTRLLFIAGKGDGNIRFYELSDEAPHYHDIGQYFTKAPQQALGVMPKRGLDFRRCEVTRFYKLHANAACCEPISVIVPRRFATETVRSDIYPPFTSGSPAITATEWIAGVNRPPVLVPMRDYLDTCMSTSLSKRSVHSTASESRLNLSSSSKTAIPTTINFKQTADSPAQTQTRTQPKVSPVPVCGNNEHVDVVTLSSLTATNRNVGKSTKNNVDTQSSNVTRQTLVQSGNSSNEGESVSIDEDLPPVAAFIRNSPFYASLNSTSTTLRVYRTAPTQIRRKVEVGVLNKPVALSNQKVVLPVHSLQNRSSSLIKDSGLAVCKSTETTKYNSVTIAASLPSEVSQTPIASPARATGSGEPSRKRYANNDENSLSSEADALNETELRAAYAAQCELVCKQKEDIQLRDQRIAELLAKQQMLESACACATTVPKMLDHL